MMYFSHDLLLSTIAIANITGAIVFTSSIAVFFSGIGFYAYAFFRLPTSTQELVFLREAMVTIDHHMAGTSGSPSPHTRDAK
jgi:hypothetical protein